jgi:hypothetical protein
MRRGRTPVVETALPKLLIAISFVVIVASNIAFAASLSVDDMVNFLAQSLCLDASGKPTSQIPIIDNCTSMRPQRADDRAVYQKHDWPDQRVYPQYYLTGHQASDSVLVNSTASPVIEQTLDFGGDPDHRFGFMDANDGGQVVLIVHGWATAVMTQDAGAGVQWFTGNGCKRSVEDGRLSWLFFNKAVPTGRWADTVANLGLGHSASDCPQQFNLAYTRFRREQVVFPFRLVNGNTVTTSSRPLDVIVTDHFGGGNAANPAANPSLERFFFARHLGWVRWEAWKNGGSPAFATRWPAMLQQAKALNAARRCPVVDYSTSPGPGWHEIDCRIWTTIVRVTKPWSVRGYHWPALENADWGGGSRPSHRGNR